MLLNSVLHGSAGLANVDFTAFTRNLVDYNAVLLSWFHSILWSHKARA